MLGVVERGPHSDATSHHSMPTLRGRVSLRGHFGQRPWQPPGSPGTAGCRLSPCELRAALGSITKSWCDPGSPPQVCASFVPSVWSPSDPELSKCVHVRVSPLACAGFSRRGVRRLLARRVLRVRVLQARPGGGPCPHIPGRHTAPCSAHARPPLRSERCGLCLQLHVIWGLPGILRPKSCVFPHPALRPRAGWSCCPTGP